MNTPNNSFQPADSNAHESHFQNLSVNAPSLPHEEFMISKPAPGRKIKGIHKPTELVSELETARAMCRAVNGEGIRRIPAIQYLNGLLAECSGSDKTLIAKRLTVAIFANVLTKTKRAGIEIWEVTSNDIGQFKARLIASGLAGVTIRCYLDMLGALFSTAVKRKVLRNNVVHNVSKPPRPRNSPRRPFTDKELQKVCDIADDEWFSMIMFALYTGLRLGDVSRLVYRDIDFQTNFIRANIKKTKAFEPKPIPPPLMHLCKALKPPDNLDQPLFPRAYGLAMANRISQLSNMFVKLLIKAGVRAPNVRVRGCVREGGEKYIPLSFHCLRHNHTSMLKRGKIPEAVARKIAGHLSVAISDVYTSLGEDVTLAAVKDLPEIINPTFLYPVIP